MLLGLGLFGFVDDGEGFILVSPAQVPGVRFALPDDFLGNEWFGDVEGVALAQRSIDRHLL